MRNLSSSNKHPLQRGFIAILLLVIFFALAIILPRVFTVGSTRSLPLIIGYIDVKHQWISNETLVLLIRNNYSKVVVLDRFKCGLNEYYLNNTVVKPGETIEISLKLNINKTCLATIIYKVDNFKYGKLTVINTHGSGVERKDYSVINTAQIRREMEISIGRNYKNIFT